jgi:arsenate reductase
VYNILRDADVDFESVNYYVDPIPKKKLKELLKKLGLPTHDLLRTKEPIYKELGLDKRILSEKEIIELMEQYPDLIQRTIFEKGSRAILARPAEKIKELL